MSVSSSAYLHAGCTMRSSRFEKRMSQGRTFVREFVRLPDYLFAVGITLLGSLLLRVRALTAKTAESSEVLVVGTNRVWAGIEVYASEMMNCGWKYTVIVEEAGSLTRKHSAIDARLAVLPRRSIHSAVITCFAALWRGVHIVEFYNFGNPLLHAFYGQLVRCSHFPISVIFTGADLLYWESRPLRSRIIRMTADRAHFALFKEPYMAAVLEEHSIAVNSQRVEIRNSVRDKAATSSLSFHAKRLVFLNSFKAFRNIDYLLAEMQHAVRLDSEISLDLIGYRNQSEYERVAKLVDTLSLHEFVRIQPFTANPLESFQGKSLFVLPADHVYLNNSTIEAMSVGLPVMLNSDAASVEKIVPDDRTGFLVPLIPKAWARRIVDVVNDPELLSVVGLNGKIHVTASFSSTEVGSYLNSLYLDSRAC